MYKVHCYIILSYLLNLTFHKKEKTKKLYTKCKKLPKTHKVNNNKAKQNKANQRLKKKVKREENKNVFLSLLFF